MCGKRSTEYTVDELIISFPKKLMHVEMIVLLTEKLLKFFAAPFCEGK